MNRFLTRTVTMLCVLLMAGSALADSVIPSLAEIPVQAGGRVKPFDTYARELLREISGKETWEGWDATDVCFSMMEDGDTWKQKTVIRVDHLELKEQHAMERGRKFFSFDELLGNASFVTYAEELRQSGREDFDDLEKAALETYNKMVRVDMATRKLTPALVPSVNDADAPWMSMGELESMQGAPFVQGLVSAWEPVQAAALRGTDEEKAAALGGWEAAVSGLPGFALSD
ncbi:MAG: hypothetical protein HKN12_06890, partial [Gemmatimonadetes bacterium]|nr:hypothetical protein [Gemmatimonadota bacterium]